MVVICHKLLFGMSLCSGQQFVPVVIGRRAVIGAVDSESPISGLLDLLKRFNTIRVGGTVQVLLERSAGLALHSNKQANGSVEKLCER
jgi:hypothetical protein